MEELQENNYDSFTYMLISISTKSTLLYERQSAPIYPTRLGLRSLSITLPRGRTMPWDLKRFPERLATLTRASLEELELGPGFCVRKGIFRDPPQVRSCPKSSQEWYEVLISSFPRLRSLKIVSPKVGTFDVITSVQKRFASTVDISLDLDMSE